MHRQALRTVLAALVCLALLPSFTTGSAQGPVDPTPTPDPPTHKTGFIPPQMDLSHLTGQRPPAGGIGAQAAPSSWDWRDYGMVTPVKDQGSCNACYAYAGVANIESHLAFSSTMPYDLSENHAKSCTWRALNNYQYPPGQYWGHCDGGNYRMFVNLYSQTGTVLEAYDPYVDSKVDCTTPVTYEHTVTGWGIISGDALPNTDVLKQYIYAYGPVYTALYVGDGDAWQSTFHGYNGGGTLYYAGTAPTPNHAALIVGWDDSLTHAGGSGGWIAKNSWGTGWGDGGFFYIAYGSANIGMYSSYVYDWQAYDPYGEIWYYDEDGWTGGIGYGDTTAWGMTVFTTTVDSNLAGIEFWTTDATSDVDVYIYDYSSGGTSGVPLWQSENHSFNEAGYHSVPVTMSLPVSATSAVAAVVKYTNVVYTYPVPYDGNGPVSGSTYISYDGSLWSRQSGRDVAIRLRTQAPNPELEITKRVLDDDPAPGQAITFTLSVWNTGVVTATNVVVTDVLSSDILTPTWDASPALAGIAPRGVISYAWSLPDLSPGISGVITIYGSIRPTLPADFVITNTAVITGSGDLATSNNQSTVLVGIKRAYLPLVLKEYRP